MPFDDEVALERQVTHFKGQIKAGRDDAGLALEIVLDVVGGCSCVSLFGSDRCRPCRAYYLLMGFVAAARADAGPGKARVVEAPAKPPPVFLDDEDDEGELDVPLPDPKAEDPLACPPCRGSGNSVGGSGDPDVIGAYIKNCDVCYGTGTKQCVDIGCLADATVVESSGGPLCEDHRTTKEK